MCQETSVSSPPLCITRPTRREVKERPQDPTHAVRFFPPRHFAVFLSGLKNTVQTNVGGDNYVTNNLDYLTLTFEALKVHHKVGYSLMVETM